MTNVIMGIALGILQSLRSIGMTIDRKLLTF